MMIFQCSMLKGVDASYKSSGYTAVKTCCCVRDVLQGNNLNLI